MIGMKTALKLRITITLSVLFLLLPAFYYSIQRNANNFIIYVFIIVVCAVLLRSINKKYKHFGNALKKDTSLGYVFGFVFIFLSGLFLFFSILYPPPLWVIATIIILLILGSASIFYNYKLSKGK